MSPDGLAVAPDVESRIAELEKRITELADAARRPTKQGVAIVCFSGEWDRLFAAFTIANGALAMGRDVHMFFTFWGATAVRTACPGRPRGSWLQRMLGRFLPRKVGAAPLSRMNWCGMSKPMLKRLMKQNGIDDLPTLVEQARELGAHFHCCDTSFRLFGWGPEDVEQPETVDWCGVASFLGHAFESRVTLFI
jgi:peroxiredoxin family protein